MEGPGAAANLHMLRWADATLAALQVRVGWGGSVCPSSSACICIIICCIFPCAGRQGWGLASMPCKHCHPSFPSDPTIQPPPVSNPLLPPRPSVLPWRAHPGVARSAAGATLAGGRRTCPAGAPQGSRWVPACVLVGEGQKRVWGKRAAGEPTCGLLGVTGCVCVQIRHKHVMWLGAIKCT